MRIVLILVLGILTSNCNLRPELPYDDLPATTTSWDGETNTSWDSERGDPVQSKPAKRKRNVELKFVILPLSAGESESVFRSRLYLLLDTELFPVAECPYPFVDNYSPRQMGHLIGADYNFGNTVVGASAHDTQSERYYWVDLEDNRLHIRSESNKSRHGALIRTIKLDEFTANWLQGV